MNQQEADKILELAEDYIDAGDAYIVFSQFKKRLNSFVSEDEPLTINLDGRVCPPGTVSPKHKLHIKPKLETDTEIAKRLWEEWQDYRGSWQKEARKYYSEHGEHMPERLTNWTDWLDKEG